MQYQDAVLWRRRISRLVEKASERPVVFVVGAGLSRWRDQDGAWRGVDGVTEVIERAKRLFASEGLAPPLSADYSEVLAAVGASFDVQTQSRLLREAVLQARLPESRATLPAQDQELLELCRKLDGDASAWDVPPGTMGLARLIAAIERARPARPCLVITTNFDCLVEAALTKVGVPHKQLGILRNQSPEAARSQVSVWHVHGYWLDPFMMHGHLNVQRELLANAMTAAFDGSQICVLAYGAWEDIVFSTICETLRNVQFAQPPDVLWAFFEQDPQEFDPYVRRVSTGLGNLPFQPVFFKGIDAHVELTRALGSFEEPGVLGTSAASTTLEVLEPSICEELAIRGLSVETGHRGLSQEQDGKATFQDGTGAPTTASRLLSFVRKTSSRGGGSSASDGQGCDVPPHRSAWVGREHELESVVDGQFHVIAITGIGGQGKSVLAAEHLERAMAQGIYEVWDWRDCREEGDTLLTHFSHILERFHPEAPTVRELAGVSASDLAPLVADIVSKKRVLFVFDNVDHYVDADAHRLLGAFDLFVTGVLRGKRQGKLILTCRPKIQYEAQGFLSVPLAGFEKSDAMRLFEARGVVLADLGTQTQVDRACKITNGHPLWLNLIAVQVAKQSVNLKDLLDRIEAGQSTDLPSQTLKAIWSTLNDNHRILLRLLAEAVRPETEERIGAFAEAEMNWNRFSKALRFVRNVDLVVVKSISGSPDLLELHPMVREYVKRQFPKQDRKRFIDHIVRYIDRLIAQYRPQLSLSPGFSILDIWTQRAELMVNAGAYEEALQTLEEIRSVVIDHGYAEEFTRIALRLYSEIDWVSAIANDYAGFDATLTALTTELSQFGRHSEVEQLLNRYESSIHGKGSRYIALCSERCYSLWFQHKFEEAMIWGGQGMGLKDATQIDTTHDCSHNYALAERDSGEPLLALPRFLKDHTLEDILGQGAESLSIDGTVFGNAGRCLWMVGRTDEALKCYKTSARKLESRDDGSLINAGYARLWIAQALERADQHSLAHVFYRAAEQKWSRVSPPRALEAKAHREDLERRHRSTVGPYVSDESVEPRCRRWILSD